MTLRYLKLCQRACHRFLSTFIVYMHDEMKYNCDLSAIGLLFSNSSFEFSIQIDKLDI